MRAKLAQSWLLVLPFLTLNTVLTALRFEPGFTAAFFLSTGKVLLMGAANSAMAMGLSLVNPAWVQKSSAYMINMQLIAFLAMGSLIIPDLLYMGWLHAPMAWGVAW